MAKFKSPDQIKVGVVGYGAAFNMGRTHLEEMKKAGMTPAAVADPDASRLAAAREEFPGIETYSSLDEMLAKSDVRLISLITPHNMHAEMALKAIKAGRHVVSEKPLAITTDECDAMIAAANKADVVLSAYHNRHWDGSIREALRQIHAGTIGDVVRVEAHMGSYQQPQDWWRSSKTVAGSILHDWGVHLLEYAFQIIPSDVVEVTGFANRGFWAPKVRWQADTLEDEGFAVVRFASGQWLTLMISSIEANPKRGMLEVTGTRGAYLMFYSEWETVVPRDGGGTVVTRGRNPAAEGWRYYQNIADHLVTGAELVITPEWARRPIHVLDLACRSAEQGVTLKTKYK
jgi:scyllo-inositol 2-dehydrogenase (NADP+)